MSKFAPVAPIQILEEMSPGLFGNYHLFLAHHTVEYPDRFKELISKHVYKRPYNLPTTVIMDNSIVELGGAVDDDMILEACRIIVPERSSQIQVIPCLPDVMGEGPATTVLSQDAYHRWVSAKLGMGMVSMAGFMLVTQGETKQDFINLVNYFFLYNKDKFPEITWAGIPRHLLKQWDVSRKWAIRYIQMVAPHIKIHLLGFSEDTMADMLDAREPGVTGIDSAVPVRCPVLIRPDITESEIGPRGDWMETGELTNLSIANIQRVRTWIDTSQLK